jgi:hypothetical protein
MSEKKNTALDELKQLERETNERRAALKVQAAKSKGAVTLDLSEPVTVNGEVRSRLSVRPHTVRDIKLAEEEREGWAVPALHGRLGRSAGDRRGFSDASGGWLPGAVDLSELDDALVGLASITSWQPSELLGMTARDFVGYLSAAARLQKRKD